MNVNTTIKFLNVVIPIFLNIIDIARKIFRRFLKRNEKIDGRTFFNEVPVTLAYEKVLKIDIFFSAVWNVPFPYWVMNIFPANDYITYHGCACYVGYESNLPNRSPIHQQNDGYL